MSRGAVHRTRVLAIPRRNVEDFQRKTMSPWMSANGHRGLFCKLSKNIMHQPNAGGLRIFRMFTSSAISVSCFDQDLLFAGTLRPRGTRCRCPSQSNANLPYVFPRSITFTIGMLAYFPGGSKKADCETGTRQKLHLAAEAAEANYQLAVGRHDATHSGVDGNL